MTGETSNTTKLTVRHHKTFIVSKYMTKGGYVYIMSNVNRTTFYIGVTSNIERRVSEHKAGVGSEFTSKYNLHDLLLAGRLPDIEAAIQHEKQLKNWHRDWKLNLIRQENPELSDLAKDWFSKQDIQDIKGIK